MAILEEIVFSISYHHVLYKKIIQRKDGDKGYAKLASSFIEK